MDFIYHVMCVTGRAGQEFTYIVGNARMIFWHLGWNDIIYEFYNFEGL